MNQNNWNKTLSINVLRILNCIHKICVIWDIHIFVIYHENIHPGVRQILTLFISPFFIWEQQTVIGLSNHKVAVKQFTFHV